MTTSSLSTLLIASGNSGKVQEIKELLADFSTAIISAAEYNLAEPEENGSSFEENALLKARYYGQKTGLPALADDSGLVIPALGGKPGIYSARWAGEHKDFSLAMERIKQELYQAHGREYTIQDKAYFACALALYWPATEKHIIVEGRVEGHLTFPPRGAHGFGYDPIFIPAGYTTTFAEMDSTIKQTISHRRQAFEALKDAAFIR